MSSGYEKKDVSVKGIILGTIALVVIVVAMVVFIRDYFVINMENAITQSALDNPSEELLAIRKVENELLTNYGVLDSEKGLYQIPIELAMDLIVEEYK